LFSISTKKLNVVKTKNNLMLHRLLKYWNGSFHSATIYGMSTSRRIMIHLLDMRVLDHITSL